jgi:transposase
MPAAYSKDLRERVIRFIERGGSQAKAAEQFRVSLPSIVRWLQRKRRTGEVSARKQGRKGGTSCVKAEALQAYIREHADETLREIGRHFGVSGVTIWTRLHQLGYAFRRKASSAKNVVKRNPPPSKR